MRIQMATLTRGAIACAALTLGMSALAATPVANEKIAVAKASVQRAEQSGAPELAPVEMAAAREKLARAEKAATDREPKPAAMLADQANIDAQVAEATAQQQRSHKAAMEFDASMQALRGEAIRATQPAQ
ncbi:MAG: DUF4398 domain-containing protein [Gammaproteobacteria bacterium]